MLNAMLLRFISVSMSLASARLTLLEREYKDSNAGLNDGYLYDKWDLESDRPQDAPGFAQGYLLTDAAQNQNARCLDGTPAIYYHAKGFGSGANKWFLHQQGGGWCYDLDGCVGRSKGSLGSTKADPKTRTLDGGYFSWDNSSNPLMYNWNKVELRYCDGASLSGDKASPTNVSGTILHFRGRAILDAEIDHLLHVNGMQQATDVIVSGCSAGGLATFLHCDHWAAAIADATRASSKGPAKVACMPDSGFFLDEDRSPQYHSKMRNVYSFQESSAAGLNAACVDAHKGDAGGAWKCIFAQWSSQHIQTPTFPMQSQYDSWQTGNVIGGADAGKSAAETQNTFGKNLTSLVLADLLSAPQHGIFLDSCHHHCGAWDGPEIDGTLIGSALFEWYTKGSPALPNHGLFNQHQPYPCDACCKPS